MLTGYVYDFMVPVFLVIVWLVLAACDFEYFKLSGVIYGNYFFCMFFYVLLSPDSKAARSFYYCSLALLKVLEVCLLELVYRF